MIAHRLYSFPLQISHFYQMFFHKNFYFSHTEKCFFFFFFCKQRFLSLIGFLKDHLHFLPSIDSSAICYCKCIHFVNVWQIAINCAPLEYSFLFLPCLHSSGGCNGICFWEIPKIMLRLFRYRITIDIFMPDI